MYILKLFYTNASKNGDGEFNFVGETGAIAKWTLLPGTGTSLERLRLITLALGGPPFLTTVPFPFEEHVGQSGSVIQVEYVMMRHTPRDCAKGSSSVIGGGVRVVRDGTIVQLPRAECRHLQNTLQVVRLRLGSGCRRYLLLAYGPTFRPHCGSDCFSFEDAFHRRTRFQSILIPDARITDPVMFLENLHYRMKVGRLPAAETFELLCTVFREYFFIDTVHWLDRGADLGKEWMELNPDTQKAVLPIIDAVRHTMDASPHERYPLSRPGVLLFHRPDNICPPRLLPRWIDAVDRLFPCMQFVVSLSNTAVRNFPDSVKARQFPVPEPSSWEYRRNCHPVARLPKGTVLLVDVDGRMPNVALMKLSRYFSRRNRKVTLVRHDGWRLVRGASMVYASCVFNRPSSLKRVTALRRHFGDSLRIGGSGVDLKIRLPWEIESCPEDYSLYSETGTRAIGFLTRGCLRNCTFCVVPEKEGKPRQVSDLDQLLQGRENLVLLDDNILAHPEADKFFEQMACRDIAVNFNQTLDIRFMNRDRARLLRRIRCMNYSFTRNNYYFSLNDCRGLDLVRRNYELLGFSRKDNVQFICMYGYDTTLEEDVKRLRFLRSLTGAYVFMQIYSPPPGRRPLRALAFFSDQADELIDELISILFPQNMKSVEQYYRWLSERYYSTFGRLKGSLVDAIFRYNYRDGKGRYLADHPPRKSFRTTSGSYPKG